MTSVIDAPDASDSGWSQVSTGRGTRRRFLRLFAVGTAGAGSAALLVACGAGGSAVASGPPTEAVRTTAIASGAQTTAGSTVSALSSTASSAVPASTSASAAGSVATTVASSASVAGKGSTTIEVLHRGAPAQATDVKQAADLFNKKFAGTYQATVSFEPGDYIKKLLTLMASDTMPDVFYINAEQASSIAVKGAFYNLNSIAAEDPSTKDYWPNLLDESKFQGKLFGLPKDFSPYVVWINLDRFQEVGIAVPKADWTWSDYTTAAQALTKPGGGGNDYFGSYLLSATWVPWVWQNGGDIFNSDYTKVTLGDTPAVDALQFLADQMNKSKVALRSDTLSSSHQTIYQWFGSGHIGMWPMGRWAVPPLRDLKNVNWDCVPLPRQATAANISLQSGPAVAATTKAAKASWEFLKVWTGPDGEQLNIDSGASVPPLTSTAIRDAFLAKTPPSRQGNQIFYDAISIGHLLPASGSMDWLAISQVTEPELGPVWRGTVTAKEAVTKIVPKLEYLLTQKSS